MSCTTLHSNGGPAEPVEIEPVRKLSDFMALLPGARTQGDLDVEVTGVSYDSRNVESGHVFVAIRGAVTDGNRYVEEAARRGAVACISEKEYGADLPLRWIRVPDARVALADLAQEFYNRPSLELQLTGITGTKGKTTTSYLVNSVMDAAGLPTCRLGTIDYRIRNRTWAAERTTPESIDLQRILRQSLQEGCTHAVLEVSSHSLALHRVKGCRFMVSCFTNLSRDHLDYHTDFESYFLAKQRLFVGDEVEGPDQAVLNIDDSWGKRLRHAVACPVTTYGRLDIADVRPDTPVQDLNPIRFRALTPRGVLTIDSRLVGLGNLYNILATVAIGQALGLNNAAIERGIQQLEGVPGRLEIIDCGQPFTVIVDYAHTDVALENLLLIARGLNPNRIITVFGCGGNRDRTKRPLMGELAARHSHIVIVTSDNPRKETPEDIIADIETGIRRVTTRYLKQVDRKMAISQAIGLAQAGDIVLLAGKGHEPYQEFADRTIPFDDREVSRELLRKKMEGTL